MIRDIKEFRELPASEYKFSRLAWPKLVFCRAL